MGEVKPPPAPEANHALTIKLDHSMGANQSRTIGCRQVLECLIFVPHLGTVGELPRIGYDCEMSHAGDIDARDREIDDLVGNGEHEQFVIRLIDFTRDFGSRRDLDTALILSGECNELLREEREGVVEPGEFKRTKRQLLQRGLQLKSSVIDSTALAA